jgi:hypothetical protein
MILNRFDADPSRLRVAIFSTPKTGNSWLRALIRHAYGLPDVYLAPERSFRSFADLGPAWVSHQHYFPSEELVATLLAEEITVLTTLRHPGDTLVSYFQYVASSPNPPESPDDELLLKDKGSIGDHTAEFARRFFPAIYSYSKAWSDLGAQVVRYEDLFANPLKVLRGLAALLGAAPEDSLRWAVLLCRPDVFRVSGEVDPRHLWSARPKQWKSELPSALVDRLRTTEPYVEICRTFGYDWDPDRLCPAYDYSEDDPFHGARHFENRVPIVPIMVRALLDHAPAEIRDRADRTGTGPGSFWEWLAQPSPMAAAEPALPGGLLTNLMASIYLRREDLQKRFPEVVGRDRFNFAWLFIWTCAGEYELPWEFVLPVQRALTGYLNKVHSDG